MSKPELVVESIPEPSAEELQLAYKVGARSRSLEEHIVRLVNRGEVKFAIWGPGEEVHGTATALALFKVVNPDAFGFVPHYRSGSLCSMWCHLRESPGPVVLDSSQIPGPRAGGFCQYWDPLGY